MDQHLLHREFILPFFRPERRYTKNLEEPTALITQSTVAGFESYELSGTTQEGRPWGGGGGSMKIELFFFFLEPG